MGLIWLAAAAVWGFGEATAFFLVPDILLTAAVLRRGLLFSLRLGLTAALAAALGGLLMWRWGAADPAAARNFLLGVPAIGQDLLRRVQTEVAGNWLPHLAIGAITGVPYKIYAVEAGAGGIDPLSFALGSVTARFTRFAGACLIVAGCHAGLKRLGGERWSYPLLGLGWALIYSGYFTWRGLQP